MKDIDYRSNDGSLIVKLQFIRSHNLKNYRHVGKCYPPTTQCLLYMNGQFTSCGEVVKHRKDKDDKKLALTLATKKALKSINVKFIRIKLWDLFFKQLNEM